MAKRRIFTVGFQLPGDEFEYIEFESNQTLLDADIVLFEPTFGDYHTNVVNNGQPVLPEYYREQVRHWRDEIIEAFNAGKLVIVYLAKPLDWYRYTGEQQFSGTGRS